MFPSCMQSSSAPVVSDSAPLSEGISLKGLWEFYAAYVDDKMSPACTTADILPVVKRITMADPSNSNSSGRGGGGEGGGGVSYCEFIQQQAAQISSSAATAPSSPPDKVGSAKYFISHAWKYNFKEFLLALEMKFQDEPSALLWIDLFSHNQHNELTSDQWISAFKEHIVGIGHTVMILFPWDNPLPFTR